MNDLLVIGVIHLIGLAFLTCLTVFFTVFEIRNHGWKEFYSNPFVMVVLASSVSFITYISVYVSCFFLFYRLGPLSIDQRTREQFQAVYGIPVVLALVGHVQLLFSRSQAVFTTNWKFLKYMRIIMYIFNGLSLLVIISLLIFCVFPNPGTQGFNVASYIYDACAPSSAGVLAVMDISSTISFGRYVHQVNSERKNGFVAIQEQVQQTEIIARRGVLIAATSTTGFFAFASQQIMGTPELHEWCVQLSTVFVIIVISLWMFLKMELDIMASSHTAELSIEAQLRRPLSK
jgi:hypothetical protein